MRTSQLFGEADQADGVRGDRHREANRCRRLPILQSQRNAEGLSPAAYQGGSRAQTRSGLRRRIHQRPDRAPGPGGGAIRRGVRGRCRRCACRSTAMTMERRCATWPSRGGSSAFPRGRRKRRGRRSATSSGSHPLDEAVHHALLAGLVERDGKLVAVDGDDIAVAELQVEHAVADREVGDRAGRLGDQLALDGERGAAALWRLARRGGGRRLVVMSFVGVVE